MLTGTTRRLTDADRAREPRSLAVVAWFDGNHQGTYPGARPRDYPRQLDPSEAEAWREGWREGHAERVCHAWHGFYGCDHDHPPHMPREDERP